MSRDPSVYHKYKILKPFRAKMGAIAAWFDQIGGGIQYKTANRAEELLFEGYLEEVFE